MGYWGWRRLLTAFVSVWVAGCSATSYTAPVISPTPRPYITLTVRSPQLATPPPAAPAVRAAERRPSPTPVTYAVQSGDTLSGIALQFGVPLAALESANPGLDPLRLPIGQILAIPNPLFDAAGQPALPTATPLALALASPACRDLPTDQVMCIGFVANELDYAVERVGVRVRLVSADGQVLAQGETSVEQGVIPPGQVAPYRVLLRADWRAVAGAVADLRSAERAASPFIPITFEQDQGRWEAEDFVVTAQLHNAGQQPVRVRRAVVTLWDATDRLTGYRVVEADAHLAAGERLPLEVIIRPPLPAQVARYRLYVEAQAGA